MLTVYNNTLVRLALSSAARTDGAVNGTAVDCGVFGNNFRDVTFVVITGTITDGTHAFTLEESDASGSGYAAVDSTRVLGSLPSVVAADDGVVFAFGCRPTKRYVRAVVTTSGSTTGGIFSAAALLGSGGNHPVARA